jgi:hypothetical protein
MALYYIILQSLWHMRIHCLLYCAYCLWLLYVRHMTYGVWLCMAYGIWQYGIKAYGI